MPSYADERERRAVDMVEECGGQEPHRAHERFRGQGVRRLQGGASRSACASSSSRTAS